MPGASATLRPAAAVPIDGDGRGVALEIAPCVGGGARRLAEHVVGMAIAVALGGAGAVERLLDGRGP